MTPPAPTLETTVIGASTSFFCCITRCNVRAMTSLAPPGPDIATISTGRSGFQSAACAVLPMQIAATMSTDPAQRCRKCVLLPDIIKPRPWLIRLHARVFDDLRVFDEFRLDECSQFFGRAWRGICALSNQPVAKIRHAQNLDDFRIEPRDDCGRRA